jgi:hypothetical protein
VSVANFIVVLGADSDARFPEGGDTLRVTNFPTRVGRVDMSYLTRHSEEGYESAVPREMWIDVRGEAEAELPEVVQAYANAGAQLLPLIAVSANAWVGDAEPKIGFDATPRATERRHFTNFVPEEFGTLPRPGRNVDVAATVGLLKAVGGHPEEERLMRAMAQYALALGHWKMGHETLALAHLYMGIEALTPIALRREKNRSGLDDDALAERYGIDERRRGARATKLHALIRRQILFQGDDEAASKARQASDGFEHAFLDFAEVRGLAQAVRDRTARYLRGAIFDFCDLEEATRATLEAPPFDTPLRSFVTRYMWGTLLGEAEDMAAPDQAYPVLKWRSRLKEFRREPDGMYSVTPEETMTMSFNEALQYRRDRFEIWGPEGARAEPGEIVVDDDPDEVPGVQRTL